MERSPAVAGADRHRLIAAAAGLCTECGYDEITAEAIAARAGVPADAMAKIFAGGRAECLAAAANTVLHSLVGAVASSYSADRSEWESAIHGIRAILELAAENPEFAYLGYVFSRQMAPGQVKEVNQAFHQVLEAMLERGWEYSASSQQPRSAALGALGGSEALVRRELVAGRPERLPTLLPDTVYTATVSFLGQEEALRLARRARELAAAG